MQNKIEHFRKNEYLLKKIEHFFNIILKIMVITINNRTFKDESLFTDTIAHGGKTLVFDDPIFDRSFDDWLTMQKNRTIIIEDHNSINRVLRILYASCVLGDKNIETYSRQFSSFIYENYSMLFMLYNYIKNIIFVNSQYGYCNSVDDFVACGGLHPNRWQDNPHKSKLSICRISGGKKLYLVDFLHLWQMIWDKFDDNAFKLDTNLVLALSKMKHTVRFLPAVLCATRPTDEISAVYTYSINLINMKMDYGADIASEIMIKVLTKFDDRAEMLNRMTFDYKS